MKVSQLAIHDLLIVKAIWIRIFSYSAADMAADSQTR